MLLFEFNIKIPALLAPNFHLTTILSIIILCLLEILNILSDVIVLIFASPFQTIAEQDLGSIELRTLIEPDII